MDRKSYTLRPLPHRTPDQCSQPLDENRRYSLDELRKLSPELNEAIDKISEQCSPSSPVRVPEQCPPSSSVRISEQCSPSSPVNRTIIETQNREIEEISDTNVRQVKYKKNYWDDTNSSLVYNSEDEPGPDDSVSQVSHAAARPYDSSEIFIPEAYFAQKEGRKNHELNMRFRRPPFRMLKSDDRYQAPSHVSTNDNPLNRAGVNVNQNRHIHENQNGQDNSNMNQLHQVFSQLEQIKGTFTEMFEEAKAWWSNVEMDQMNKHEIRGNDDNSAPKQNKEKDEAHTLSYKPKFNGKSSFHDFIIHLEAVADSEKWSDQDKGKILLKSLEGQATSILGSIPSESRSDYEVLKETLKQRFNPNLDSDIAGSLAQSRKRKKGESHLVFVQELKKLVGSANPLWTPDIIDSLTREKFFAALEDPHMRSTLWARQPKSVDEAAIMADALEKLKEDSHTGQMAMFQFRQEDRRKMEHKNNKQNRNDKSESDHKFNVQAEAFYPKAARPNYNDIPNQSRGGYQKSGQNGQNDMRGNNRSGGQESRTNSPMVCYLCLQPGHIKRNCPMNKTNQMPRNNPEAYYNAAPYNSEN